MVEQENRKMLKNELRLITKKMFASCFIKTYRYSTIGIDINQFKLAFLLSLPVQRLDGKKN